MLTFCDNIIFTQGQIYTTLAEMSNVSLLWKLRKTVMFPPYNIVTDDICLSAQYKLEDLQIC